MTSKTAWLLLSLLPLQAAAIGSGQRTFHEPLSAKQEASVAATMKSLTAEKVQKYVDYWKRVDTRGQQARDREARKPVNAQGDLGAMFRDIRAEASAHVGLDRRAVKDLDLAVKTYFDSQELSGGLGCATGVPQAQIDAELHRREAEEAAKKAAFVSKYGEPAYTLLHDQEKALNEAVSARETYEF